MGALVIHVALFRATYRHRSVLLTPAFACLTLSRPRVTIGARGVHSSTKTAAQFLRCAVHLAQDLVLLLVFLRLFYWVFLRRFLATGPCGCSLAVGLLFLSGFASSLRRCRTARSDPESERSSAKRSKRAWLSTKNNDFIDILILMRHFYIFFYIQYIQNPIF